MIRAHAKLSLQPLLLGVIVIFSASSGIGGMEPRIKSIIKKPSHVKSTKRVAFKAQTLFVCWSAWRRPLFSDKYLPLSPLFDPCVVHDWGIIEIEEL